MIKTALPNALSILRIILLVPLSWFFLRGASPAFILAIIAIILATDALDGFFARRFHTETKIGEWLDAVADALFLFVTLFFLFVWGKFSFTIFLLLILPKILIGISILIYRIQKKHWITTHFIGGKIAFATISLLILWLLLNFPSPFFVTWLTITVTFACAIFSEYQRLATGSVAILSLLQNKRGRKAAPKINANHP